MLSITSLSNINSPVMASTQEVRSDPCVETKVAQASLQTIPTHSMKDTIGNQTTQITPRRLDLEMHLLTDHEWKHLGIDSSEKNQWSLLQTVKIIDAIEKRRALHLCNYADWLAGQPEGKASGGIGEFLATLKCTLSFKEKGKSIRNWILKNEDRVVVPTQYFIVQHGIPLEILQISTIQKNISNELQGLEDRFFFDGIYAAIARNDFAVMQQIIRIASEMSKTHPFAIQNFVFGLNEEYWKIDSLPKEIRRAVFEEIIRCFRSNPELIHLSSTTLCKFIKNLTRSVWNSGFFVEHLDDIRFLLQQLLETKVQGQSLLDKMLNLERISVLEKFVDEPTLVYFLWTIFQPWNPSTLNIRLGKTLLDIEAICLHSIILSVGDTHPFMKDILQFLRQDCFAHLATKFWINKQTFACKRTIKKTARAVWRHPEVLLIGGLLGAGGVAASYYRASMVRSRAEQLRYKIGDSAFSYESVAKSRLLLAVSTLDHNSALSTPAPIVQSFAKSYDVKYADISSLDDVCDTLAADAKGASPDVKQDVYLHVHSNARYMTLGLLPGSCIHESTSSVKLNSCFSGVNTIVLAGCNTGNLDDPSPIAQKVADDTGKRVLGSPGYLYGGKGIEPYIQNDHLYVKAHFSALNPGPMTFEDFVVFRPGSCDASTFGDKQPATCNLVE